MGIKPTVDTHTHTHTNPNMILNIIIKSKEERTKQGGKEKDLPEQTKTINKMAITIYINNYLNYKSIKCSNKDTDFLNGSKNKAHIYAVYRRPTSDIGTHKD